ncbi:MAG: hypothetical protein LC794_07375 [Acidobacteria bacterium]|nr:hypothetical protein [Acidobacteriota bacterium]
MKDRQCEMIRRELEETALNEEFRASAANHLETCADCREFHRQQTKLRQIVGSLGTVNAPADFDFRLRARLAADADTPGFRFWTMTVRGLATAAVLVVFGVGAVVIWQRMQEPAPATVAVAPQQPPQTIEPPPVEDGNRATGSLSHGGNPLPAIADNTAPPRRKGDRPRAPKQKQTITAVDFSNVGANVVSDTRTAADTVTVFPIETSLQSLKVSLDDGRGNARTISFPTVSFGQQRVLTTGNQFAPKDGVW